MIRKGASWAAWIVLLGGAGCAAKVEQRGDETHFESCTTDLDCKDAGPGYRCASGTCQATDAGPGGGGGASGSSGGTGGTTGSSGGEPAICHLIDSTSGDVDAASVRTALGGAATSCMLRASDYDRSCAKDSDCTPVGEGNACEVPCGVECPSTAINVAALDRYHADYAKTPLGYCTNRVTGGGIFCGCPAFGNPVCVRGTCELAPISLQSTDAGVVDSGPPAPGSEADAAKCDPKKCPSFGGPIQGCTIASPMACCTKNNTCGCTYAVQLYCF